MSLYNALHGENPKTDLFLSWLDLTRDDFQRFRDAHLSADGTKVRFLARIGTNSWSDNPEAVVAALKKKPGFLREWDDEWDKTYRHIEFAVPESALEIAKDMATGEEPPTLKERSDAVLEEMRHMTPEQMRNDPRFKDTTDALEKIMNSDQPGGVIHI